MFSQYAFLWQQGVILTFNSGVAEPYPHHFTRLETVCKSHSASHSARPRRYLVMHNVFSFPPPVLLLDFFFLLLIFVPSNFLFCSLSPLTLPSPPFFHFLHLHVFSFSSHSFFPSSSYSSLLIPYFPLCVILSTSRVIHIYVHIHVCVCC